MTSKITPEARARCAADADWRTGLLELRKLEIQRATGRINEHYDAVLRAGRPAPTVLPDQSDVALYFLADARMAADARNGL